MAHLRGGSIARFHSTSSSSYFLFQSSWLQVLLISLLIIGITLPVTHADDGAVAVQVLPSREECFFEDISATGVKVFVHYLVTFGGSLDIDATFFGPDDALIWTSKRDPEGRVLFKTRAAGRHRFCFSNKMSTLTTKVVAFSIAVGETGLAAGQTKQHKGEGGMVPPQGSMDPLERSIMRIQQGLREVQEVQRYLRGRERVHRATTEVANTRVVVWSTIEILIIAFMSAGNVWYLKRIFNKRRVV